MTSFEKIAVSLPLQAAESARRAVRRGRATSVSAYIAEAIEEKAKLDDLAALPLSAWRYHWPWTQVLLNPASAASTVVIAAGGAQLAAQASAGDASARGASAAGLLTLPHAASTRTRPAGAISGREDRTMRDVSTPLSSHQGAGERQRHDACRPAASSTGAAAA
jgi:hypothetical protein